MSDSKTILCFAAHPDDIEFSCTITLYQMIQQGYEVIYIILTNGESGFKAGILPPEERAAVRRQEQLVAAEMLGVKECIFLDYRDGFPRQFPAQHVRPGGGFWFAGA